MFQEIIQVIGLPCVGKSTLLKYFKEQFPLDSIYIYDIVDYHYDSEDSLCVENKLLKSIINKSVYNSGQWNLIILESACGINDLNSKVIKIECSRERFLQQHKKRSIEYNEYLVDYYNSLSTMSIVPDVTLFIHDNESSESLFHRFYNLLHRVDVIPTKT